MAAGGPPIDSRRARVAQHQSERVAVACKVFAAFHSSQICGAGACAFQILQRNVHSSALRILAHIAQNIRQLERDACLFSKSLGSRAAVAEYPYAHQSHDGRNVVAILI